jgi:ketosteroid isomerase-like protein
VIYRAIVRRQVRTLFKQANEGNWEAIVSGLAGTFSYRFVGDTPLGGTRTTHDAMRRWFERLYRLFPGSQFDPQQIVVEGPPWNTRIMTYVKINGVIPTRGEHSAPYENEFMQAMILKWGKIVSVLTIEDTNRFVGVLPRLTSAGISDAAAPPIVD